MKKLILAVIAVVFMMSGSQAQKIKTVSGNPDVIKGDKNVNLVFTYENVKVGKMEEAAYLEREIGERDEKEAGTGEVWAGKWQADKEVRFPPRFVKLFNQYGGDYFGTNVVLDAADSKYTMKINVSWIEPGFNVGVMRKPAGTNMEISIFETANPDGVLYEATILNSPGADAMGMDFDSGYRIEESYAKAAKYFAKFLNKKHMK